MQVVTYYLLKLHRLHCLWNKLTILSSSSYPSLYGCYLPCLFICEWLLLTCLGNDLQVWLLGMQTSPFYMHLILFTGLIFCNMSSVCHSMHCFSYFFVFLRVFIFLNRLSKIVFGAVRWLEIISFELRGPIQQVLGAKVNAFSLILDLHENIKHFVYLSNSVLPKDLRS